MEKIISNYVIKEKLGEGGMGSIYKAMDTNLDRYVAIKSIHPTLTSDEELLERFKREAKLQASLVHPNIVRVYNFFSEAGNYFIVMEYIEGETLAQLIRRIGLLPPHKCLPLFKQILNAVGYAHQQNIIHRDLKPSNIIVDKTETAKVMDFGIARIAGDRSITKTGTKMGSIAYMSPEQVLGEKNIDKRADVYSLGITLFEMLTGQLPYNTATDSDFLLMQQIVQNELPSVKKYYPYVPDRVDEAIRKATRKNREERFSDCNEFLRFIEGEEILEQSNLQKKNITIPPIRTEQLVSQISPEQSSQQEKKVKRKKTGITIPKASLAKRLAATFIDALIIFITVLVLLKLSFPKYDIMDMRELLIVLLVIPFLLKDGLRKGKGFGKGIVGLRIINMNGKPISFGEGFGRALLTYLFFAFYYLGIPADIIMILVNKNGQKLADLILQMQVVEEKDFILMNEKKQQINSTTQNNYATQ